jgi:hypothetical protein
MNCEEFEIIGLGLDHESVPNAESALERAAAAEHVSICTRCAALQESWREARLELAELREATETASAPLRVEMRLRQEFHTRHRTLKVRATAVVAAWALAGAAVLVGAVSWWNWHLTQTSNVTQQVAANSAKTGSGTVATSASANGYSSADVNAADAANESSTSASGDSASDATLIADNDAEDFTLLPGSMPQETGDAAVVRVRLQRGALGALGLPVNETRAGEWIQVDLFVGQDGQPQAVRLPRQ